MASMDTLQAYTTLRAKFDESTAKTIVDAVVQLTSPPLTDMATKADLRAEISAVKAAMEQLRADLLDKMRSTALTIIGANLAALAIATTILIKVLK
ncbi:hypothetical protein [Nitrospira calida]|jgi:hypothetical protein